MSVVACRVLEKGFEIAADSITVRGYTQHGNNPKVSKLFRVDELTIGAVGFVEETELLRIFVSTHKPHEAGERALLELWTEFAEWKKERTDKREIENIYLLGVGGRMFNIHNFMIVEVGTFEAIGAGMDFALAALFLGHDVKKAVETAIELSVFCAAPVQYLRIEG
jgi:ATP-dependent protease HslVU (ClpYQ) peptidase subunit